MSFDNENRYKLISDILIGCDNPCIELYSPSRSILNGKLFINGFKSIKNLLTPTAPRCTHLGCALKYNKEEHSFDCPCHGSRFDEKMQVIDNPATDNIKKKGKNV